MDILDGIKQVKLANTKQYDNTKKVDQQIQFIWDSQKVEQWLEDYRNGIDGDHGSPFESGEIGYRKGNLNFRYSEEEIEEIKRCKADINYFADKYCFAMTDDGIVKIDLYPFQRNILKTFQDNRYTCLLASRQVGKTISSSFFITWFMCFHYEKNCMIVANKGSTVKEIIDKIKSVYENLPFFLKPGIIIDNVMSMKFDNGCRFVGQNTTKTPGLGFTIHLLYADEFAHIPPNIIKIFYKSIFPTLSSSKTSRIIVTSTANGMNKFYEIYQGAVEGKNDYAPLKIDWDAVPGRDEAWKQREIANIGSEEEFRQEYENQFFSDSQMALDRITMKKISKFQTNYIWQEIDELEDEGIRYDKLVWDPKYRDFDFSMDDKFIISVDISEGAGKDYSVINIFKVEEQSLAKIKTMRKFDDEGSFFRLRQIGVYRDNRTSIDDLSKILKVLVFEFFEEENVKIVLEMNHKGELIVNKLEQHRNYFPEIFIHTKHSMNADHLNIGVRLNKSNKPFFCSEMAYLIKSGRMVITEKASVLEALNFGIDNKGNYKSQLGNDDIIMTCVNAVAFYTSYDFYEIIEDIIDTIDPEKRNRIYDKLESRESTDVDIDYSLIANM